MASAEQIRSGFDRKNERYQKYLVRRQHNTPSFADYFKWRFRALADGEVKELPTFTKMKELGGQAAKAEEMRDAAVKNLRGEISKIEKEIEMLRWLIWLPHGDSRLALLELNDLVSARKARGALPSAEMTETDGIVNIVHRAAGDHKIAMETLVPKNYKVDGLMLENVVRAMAESLVAEGKEPRLKIYQVSNAIVIMALPHLSAQAITLLESAMPYLRAKSDGGCHVRDEDFEGGKGTFLYLEETR